VKDKELQDSQWVIEKNVKKDGDKDRLIVLPDLPDYLQDSSAGGSPATGRRSFASFNPSVEVCRAGLRLWASPYRYGSALQENMKQVLDEVQSDFRGKRALEEETSQEEMAEMYVYSRPLCAGGMLVLIAVMFAGLAATILQRAGQAKAGRFYPDGGRGRRGRSGRSVKISATSTTVHP
jgi:hypothetical protein